MTPDAERLVADNVRLAYILASRRMKHIPDIWRDDIRSAALEGLMKAADAFDPDQGWQFSTFARWRINGEMSDQLRRLHTGRRTPNGNNWHDRSREGSLEAIAETIYQNGDEPLPVGELAFLADPAADPATLVEAQVERRGAWALLDLLSERDRDLAEMYFVQGLRLADIARLEGVTEGRICQRMGVLKARLRQLAVRAELVAA